MGVVMGRIGLHGAVRRAYIGMLAVDSQCRGRGVGIHSELNINCSGRTLVKQVVEIMIKEGVDEVLAVIPSKPLLLE